MMDVVICFCMLVSLFVRHLQSYRSVHCSFFVTTSLCAVLTGKFGYFLECCSFFVLDQRELSLPALLHGPVNFFGILFSVFLGFFGGFEANHEIHVSEIMLTFAILFYLESLFPQ